MIVVSEHAKFRMQQREISEKMVIKTIKDPDNLEKSFRGRQLRQKKIGDKILEVVTKTEENKIFVITQYWLTK